MEQYDTIVQYQQQLSSSLSTFARRTAAWIGQNNNNNNNNNNNSDNGTEEKRTQFLRWCDDDDDDDEEYDHSIIATIATNSTATTTTTTKISSVHTWNLTNKSFAFVIFREVTTDTTTSTNPRNASPIEYCVVLQKTARKCIENEHLTWTLYIATNTALCEWIIPVSCYDLLGVEFEKERMTRQK
jgi:hypothetical protein